MFAEFYAKGRNSVWYGQKMASREMFESDEAFKAYLIGRKSAQAEERLDADTEWDGDEGY
jgi:hypothetical protein